MLITVMMMFMMMMMMMMIVIELEEIPEDLKFCSDLQVLDITGYLYRSKWNYLHCNAE